MDLPQGLHINTDREEVLPFVRKLVHQCEAKWLADLFMLKFGITDGFCISA